MNKLIFFVLAIFTILIVSNYSKTSNTSPSVYIKNNTFYVYTAKTDEEKSKGLSRYDKLPVNGGMIFLFSKPDYYAFWMKDMKFPIDIIYIQNYKIVDIFQNVPAPFPEDNEFPIYKPKEKANYVLEINAGLSKKYNFKIGDEVKINL